MVNSRLPFFLRNAASRRFKWGDFDCCLWLADWFVVSTGRADPARAYRGHYHDARSALRLLGGASLEVLVASIAETAGLNPTDDPLRGDIGVVRPKLKGAGLVGAIRACRGWVLLTPDAQTGSGLSLAVDDAVLSARAWRMPVT